MKRDLGLIRQILFAVEEHPHGRAPHPMPVEGYTEEELGYHCYLIVDEGLAEGVDVQHHGSPGPTYRLICLTSYGHDFVEAARSDTAWNGVIEGVKKAGGWTFGIVFQQLVARLGQSISMP